MEVAVKLNVAVRRDCFGHGFPERGIRSRKVIVARKKSLLWVNDRLAGMAKIPLWKLWRELMRLKVQAKSLPMAIYEPILQRRYDRSRETIIRVTKGTQPVMPKMVILLIFQPESLPASLIDTCTHLIDSGYAPVVVSNAPLQDNTRATLCRVSYAVLERPNFGYDFGGYRDGVWYLESEGLAPQMLLFLNDSVWFPVQDNCTFLHELEASDADYVGTQLAGNPDKATRKRGFFTSYCFMVKAPLLINPAFSGFWRDYRLSSNKEVTLRRGERAFSHVMLDHAQKSEALFDQPRFERLVEALSAQAARRVLTDLVVTATELEARRALLLQAAPEESQAATLMLIKDATRTKNYIGAAPLLSLQKMRFPMIKKNNERLYALARARIVAALDRDRLPNLRATVEEELRGKVVQESHTLN